MYVGYVELSVVCICVDVTENSGLEVDAIKLKAWQAWPVISVQMGKIDTPLLRVSV